MRIDSQPLYSLQVELPIIFRYLSYLQSNIPRSSKRISKPLRLAALWWFIISRHSLHTTSLKAHSWLLMALLHVSLCSQFQTVFLHFSLAYLVYTSKNMRRWPQVTVWNNPWASSFVLLFSSFCFRAHGSVTLPLYTPPALCCHNDREEFNSSAKI